MSDGYIGLPADGAGKRLDTEALTINGIEVHRQRVSGPLTDTQLRASSVPVLLRGMGTWATTRAVVGTTAVAVPAAALANRKSLLIQALEGNSAEVFIGPDENVTTANGWPLGPGDLIALDIGPASAVFGIAAQAGQSLAVIEVA